MPSIKTMLYKLHVQVKNFAGNQTQSPKPDNMARAWSKKNCTEMLGEIFPVQLSKTKLPEELQTELRLSRLIHNLAFLAYHSHSRPSESSGDTALCLAYLAETKNTSKTPKEYKYFMTKPASSFASPHPSISVPLSGNWETGWCCYIMCIIKATFTQQCGKGGLIAFSVIVTTVILSFRYVLDKAFSKGRMSHYSFLLKLWMSKIIAKLAAKCGHPWGLTARCWTQAYAISRLLLPPKSNAFGF